MQTKGPAACKMTCNCPIFAAYYRQLTIPAQMSHFLQKRPCWIWPSVGPAHLIRPTIRCSMAVTTCHISSTAAQRHLGYSSSAAAKVQLSLTIFSSQLFLATEKFPPTPWLVPIKSKCCCQCQCSEWRHKGRIWSGWGAI